ncbi:MAG: TldD/PmbA family protein [Bacteroidales bacterium]|nr:TldD/PmbA family protein [Bacteroidales bacterium]
MKGSDHFGISVAQLRALVSEGLRDGGDWCDLYFEDTSYHDLLLRDGVVGSGGYHVDYGCGIRVLKGEKTGYAYAETTDFASLVQAARAAGAIAASLRGSAMRSATQPRGESQESDNFAGSQNFPISSDPTTVVVPPLPCRGRQAPAGAAFRPQKTAAAALQAMANGTAKDCVWPLRCDGARADYYPEREAWERAEIAGFVPFLQRIEAGIRSRDSRVLKVVAVLSYSVSEILMFNSLGEMTCDHRPLGSISVQVIFQQGRRTENNTVSRSLRCGAEMIGEEVLEDLVSRSVAGIDERFEARRPKGGQMSVVMGAGASGILLHEAMGHAFEADFNRKGQSVFSDKMGQRICPAGINILDDGTVPASRGALNVDDEGVPGQKTYMVTDGVLTSYLHDRISAGFYGVAPTGNGRRESFRYNPIPRMRTTYMESGRDGTKEDLIASVKRGIYVDQFANGQVKIGEGDFTFFVKSGFLIEKGRLTMPVKDINIIGNGPQALADIRGVAGDLKIDEGTWTCGKEQSVAVSCGIPSVLIGNLTVGGE